MDRGTVLVSSRRLLASLSISLLFVGTRGDAVYSNKASRLVGGCKKDCRKASLVDLNVGSGRLEVGIDVGSRRSETGGALHLAVI